MGLLVENVAVEPGARARSWTRLPAAPQAWLLLAALVSPAAAAAADPCREALEQGSLEERRARFPEALAYFEDARQVEACRVEARLGLARTYNSMNDHKRALPAAEWVLENTGDPELLAAAHYEIGRALYKRGSRWTKKKEAAAEAFGKAIELSQGQHGRAVRALMRLYREAGREEEIRELEERFPDVRVQTLTEQKLAVAPKRPAAGAGGADEGGGGGFQVCATGEVPVMDPALPRFWGPDGAAQRGFQPPAKVSGKAPKVKDEDAAGGKIRFAAKVGADGLVEEVGILEGLSPAVDEAVIRAVCRWVYTPAETPEGEPTACYVQEAIELPPA